MLGPRSNKTGFDPYQSLPARGLPLVMAILYIIFFISLVGSFRAISSLSIAAIILVGIIAKNPKPSLQLTPKNLFLAGCLLLFLLHVFLLPFSPDMPEGWRDVRSKSGLFLVPLAVWLTPISRHLRNQLLSFFCLMLGAGSLYCLGIAFVHYVRSGDSAIFFYHELVGPLKHHAVYFSILIFVGLVFLWESIREQIFIIRKFIHISLVIFLSFFLFLLSSKLVIVVYLIYLLYFFISRTKKKLATTIGAFIVFITIAVLSLTLKNPVSERFNDIIYKDLSLIRQERFDPGNYFNGLQFRLLLWKFVPDILNENKGWVAGVSPSRAQYLLNQKYISKNMYIGTPERGDHGFIGYNTHNQFLESLLQTGIVGLLLLLVTCIALIWMTWQNKTRLGSFVNLLLLLWLFTESVFETQYGIAIFTFFPLFVCQGEKLPSRQTF